MTQAAFDDTIPTPALSPAQNLGAVFTRRWVVEMVLDLAGYTSDIDLGGGVALEPAVGDGAFLIPMVSRLIESAERHGRRLSDIEGSIIGYDIDARSVASAREAIYRCMLSLDVPVRLADRLANAWVRQGDFLSVAKALPPVQWVLGNPPYIRVEDIDRHTLAGYRTSWPAMTGRADLYVGFLQAGMSLLAPQGRMGVICADRWMRNQYGAALRRQIERTMSIDCCIVMHQVDAFEHKVAAYPAITIVRNGAQGPALVCDAGTAFDGRAADRLLRTWRRGKGPVADDMGFQVSWTDGWFTGAESWPDADPARLSTVTELESRLPTLENSGASVSVGVATGADRIFITRAAGRTEPDRLLKLVTARETSSGRVDWTGRFLVNPWEGKGLADLDRYPGMAAYLRRHGARLKARHIAKKHPATWWRTIDRVTAEIAHQPKLLVPDLKDRIAPVLDIGEYYPGHSLYYITSDSWDLEVLGGLLMSDIANLFIEAYSVRMANGYLRVSAQYLRRVRVPQPTDIRPVLAESLRQAFRSRDFAAANTLAREAYGLS